jgi:serine/threonine-protein kinase RsbW
LPLPHAESSARKLAFNREFAFPGDTNAMFAARDEIMQFLNANGVGGDEEIDILVALQEALANAVVHGCGNDPAKTVHCHVQGDDAEINLAVRDPGPGFDVYAGDEFEDGTNLTNHGRGILLMRSLMDEITYHHRGSEIHLKKLRSQPD